MLFFIYSRKSVYTGKGESIENQIEMCRQYIQAKFTDILKKDILIYEDEGFSGKNIFRPQLQMMLKDIKEKKPDFVICYRLDRISRSVSDFSSLIESFQEQGVSFICIKEEFDTSKPMGKAMMYIASVFAQLERETIAERVRDNMVLLARTGRWLGGTTPTGYTSERIQEIIMDGKIKTACRLKENPNELCIVTEIYEKFLEAHSICAVNKYLIQKKIKSRNGKAFSCAGIKQILQNPVYCIADKEAFHFFYNQKADICFEENDCIGRYGLLAYNKRDYKKKHIPRQPIDKWIVAIGRHKGVISGKQWTEVQSIMNRNTDKNKPTAIHNTYALLSGLLFCESCKGLMLAKLRRENAEITFSYDYICSSKLHGGTCNCQNINGPKADMAVCEYLLQYIKESSNIYRLLNKLREEIQVQNIKAYKDTKEQRTKKCKDEMEQLISILTQENLNSALIQHVNKKIEILDKELTEITQEKKELLKKNPSEKQIQLEYMAEELSDLKKSFPNLSIFEKRTFIRLIAEKIIWNGKELHIFLLEK